MCFLLPHTAQALELKNIRFGQHEDKVRMVLDLSEPSRADTSILEGPDRLVIDLQPFDWAVDNLQKPSFSKIEAIRHGQLDNSGRVVLEFKSPVSVVTKFALPPDGKGSGHRIIIDYRAGKKASSPEKTIIAPVPQVKEPTPVRKAQPKQKPLVFIDPGHGGIDPGAIAYNGIYEKHVVLQIAKRLKEHLEATGRYRVQLSREGDTFLKLHERVKKARRANADLFVSIHADSLDDKTVGGVSLYTLSNKASDEQTAKLAERENQVDLLGGVDLSHEDEDIANILIDLTTRDTSNQSKFFANTLVSQYRQSSVKTLKTAHRHAGFAVLKAPDIPSVLVECGFLSNPKEVKLLTQAEYQDKLASVLTNGIEIYFSKISDN